MKYQSLFFAKRVLLLTVLLSLFSFAVHADDAAYLDASDKAVDFLVSQMQANGSYALTDDLAAYYKSPSTLYAAGRRFGRFGARPGERRILVKW